jgi:hypothetical protein
VLFYSIVGTVQKQIMSSSSSSSGGIGFTGLLTILFIGLKLTGFITWSWWWVLSPIWISILFVIGLLLASAVFYLISNK